MNHKKIVIEWMDGQTAIVVIDRIDGVRIEDGIARFGRTETTRWIELLAAPLVNIRKWG